ncbi:MAG TPA: BA14K family protein [Aestuariivirga sp.]|nr:BA14K family protein [Aestuariivirga sp.]
MRMLIFTGLCATALVLPAQADVRSYCEAYARDQADTRLSGSAILGARSKPSPQEWEERKTLALADCLTLYTPKSGTETVVAAEPETESVAAEPEAKPVPVKPKAAPVKEKRKTATVKAKPTLTLLARRTAPAQQEYSTSETTTSLVPGSQAWKDYCANKYASFNPETNTYKSYGGKQKPCKVTKS